MVDLAHEGTPLPSHLVRLAHRGSEATDRALVQIAMSARQRAWAYVDWSGFVNAPGNELGRQAGYDGNRPLTAAKKEQRLRRAWEKAAERVRRSPDWREDLKHARHFRDLMADPATVIDDDERALLAYVASVCLDKVDRDGLPEPTVTPALSKATVIKVTGLSDHHARLLTARLVDAGVLTIAVRGRRGDPGARDPRSKGRATTYRLSSSALDAYIERKTRSYGRSPEVPAGSMGDQAPASPETDRFYGRTGPVPWVRGDDEAALLEALARLSQAKHGRDVPLDRDAIEREAVR